MPTNQNPDQWKILTRETIADLSIFQVIENHSENLSTGSIRPFYVLETNDWVNVIPITKSGEIVLIKQFRHGVQEITLEIPGGVIDQSEEPSVAAARELSEETGFTAQEFIPIGKSIPNPAIQDNRVHHFLALGCEKTGETDFDESESIQTRIVAADDIDDLIDAGEISHSLVVAAFCCYGIYLKKERQ